MADKQPGAASALTNNSLIAAVLAATGAIYLAREAPLEEERPEAYEAALHSQGFHEIEARAWQDPLAAVEAHRRGDAHGDDKCANAPSDSKHCNQLKTELAQRPNSAILAVMVTGGSFSEDVETRRRIRYAVLAGLNREGYAPEDPQRLDYFRLPPDQKTGVSADFPYEWFHRRDRIGDQALVLWVNEDSALLTNGETGHPLLALGNLFETLLPPAPAAGDAESARPQPSRAISILGPWQSDTLLSMRGERCGQRAERAGSPPFTFNFYVYGASISDKLLDERLPPQCAKFPVAWRIVTDDVVGKELVAELGRRGVFSKSPFDTLLSDWKARGSLDVSAFGKETEPLGLSRKKTAVALVSDWDTLYGWGVAKTVEDQIRTKATVERFSYLRGLDGVLTTNGQKNSPASDQKQGEDRAVGKSPGDPKIDPRAFDRAYGPSQADYLRRLADGLKARSQEYDFKAIGVLGNDVYDKLWVLRALKPAFPNAIFFTTDYDLALTSVNDLPYTRNLVVASSFGGQLRKERQREIPPFRSAYQTSAFFATQLALEGVQPTGPSSVVPQGAQLFEIARTGAIVELATKEVDNKKVDSPSDAECGNDISKCEPVIAPVRPPALNDRDRWLASIGFSLAAAWLSVIASKRDEDVKTLSRAYRLHGLLYFVAALLFGAAIAVLFWNPLAVWLMNEGVGEPLALLRGIGIWPIVALRLLLTLFCVFLTFRACRVFRNNTADLETRILGSEKPSSPTRQERDARRLIDPFLAYRIDAFVDNSDESHVDAAWKAYISQGRWQLRLGRCALWSAVALLLFALAGGFDGGPPVRAYLARYLYNFSLATNFVSASVLTLFIFDATALCVSFVEGLGRSQTQWPKEAQKDFAQRLGVAATQNTNAPGKKKKCGLLDYWIDLVFIEKHTSVVNSLVYYPFLVIALSILAHSAVLAAYPGGALIGVAEAIGLAMVFCCAIALRWASERVRRSAERHFAAEIVKLGDNKPAPGQWGSKQLQALLDRIRDLSGGAFSPLLEQPFIKALLLPVGSIGWATLQDLPSLWRL